MNKEVKETLYEALSVVADLIHGVNLKAISDDSDGAVKERKSILENHHDLVLKLVEIIDNNKIPLP